jgi:ATP-binding cassette subfamily B protein
MKLSLVLLLMIIASVVEILSIGSLFPFIAILVAPDKIYDIKLIQPLLTFNDSIDNNQLLIIFTLLFCIFTTISGILRLSLLWCQTRFSYSLGTMLSIKIYEQILYQSYSNQISRNSSEVIALIVNKINIVIGNFINPLLILLTSTVLLFLAPVFTSPELASLVRGSKLRGR